MQLSKLVVPALASALIAPSIARADLGRQGVVVLEGDVDLDVAHIVTKESDGDSSSRNGVDLTANAHYFVADHVSLGLGIDFVRQFDDDDTLTGLGTNVSAGYLLRPTSVVHFWPRVTVTVARAWTDMLGGASLTRAGIAVHVPAVIEAADHFVIGWGPIIATDLYASLDAGGTARDEEKSTILGTSAFIAGWF